MSRIEINQNASNVQHIFGKEAEFKGKHGSEGYIKTASFLARIFGYYVKVGEHYLNPKSLANYTNTKNAGKGEPALKPRWIGGTPKAKIEAAFLKLFQPQGKTTPQIVNTPPAESLQQQTSPPSPIKPPSPLKYNEKSEPVSFDMQHLSLIYKDTDLERDLKLALAFNSSFQSKFRDDLKAYLDTFPDEFGQKCSPERWSEIKDDVKTRIVNAVVHFGQGGGVLVHTDLNPQYFEDAGPDALHKYLAQFTGKEIVHVSRWVVPPGPDMPFREEAMTQMQQASVQANQEVPTQQPSSGQPNASETQPTESTSSDQPPAPVISTPPLKYEETKPVSFDLKQMGLLYTDKTLRDNLRAALNDPDFKTKFESDLRTALKDPILRTDIDYELQRSFLFSKFLPNDEQERQKYLNAILNHDVITMLQTMKDV